jgi:hypothetical protein
MYIRSKPELPTPILVNFPCPDPPLTNDTKDLNIAQHWLTAEREVVHTLPLTSELFGHSDWLPFCALATLPFDPHPLHSL